MSVEPRRENVEELSYVGESSWRAAVGFEQRFKNLKEQAGVIFISVTAEPAPKGESITYDVVLGISRKFEKDVGLALIRQVMGEEIAAGLKIRATILRGIAGSNRGEDTRRADSSET